VAEEIEDEEDPMSPNPSHRPIPTRTDAIVAVAAGLGVTPTAIGRRRNPRGTLQKRKSRSTWPKKPNQRSSSCFPMPFLSLHR